jgi:3-oxoacyl-[acyl-carrier-protein] synthase II
MAKFRASNSMHSEVAAAVSIELGIQGPWQMLANGCSAGLDALGLAWAALRSGLTRRALVVGVEFPLIPLLLQGFADTGLLASPGSRGDPYHRVTSGFHPSEAVAAMAVECSDRSDCPEILGYGANSDAYDSIALPPDGGPLAHLLSGALSLWQSTPTSRLAAICPHGNGTPSNRLAECGAIAAAFSTYAAGAPKVCLLKPATGHSLGASGALETVLLAAALREGRLPASLAGLTPPLPGWVTSGPRDRIGEGEIVIKWALGMGGHNAWVALRCRKGA